MRWVVCTTVKDRVTFAVHREFADSMAAVFLVSERGVFSGSGRLWAFPSRDLQPFDHRLESMWYIRGDNRGPRHSRG